MVFIFFLVLLLLLFVVVGGGGRFGVRFKFWLSLCMNLKTNINDLLLSHVKKCQPRILEVTTGLRTHDITNHLDTLCVNTRPFNQSSEEDENTFTNITLTLPLSKLNKTCKNMKSVQQQCEHH